MNILKKTLTKLRRGSWFPLYYTFYTRCKVDPGTVFLESRHGKTLESSVFAMLKELTANYPDRYRVVICADRRHMEVIRQKVVQSGIRISRLVRFGGLAYYHELSRAGYLVNDISFPGRFVKKEGQRYLNVWHGTPLKRMGRDDLEERMSMGNMMRNFLMADLLLYPNAYMEEKMASSFMLDKLYEGKVLHTGYPRNDVFFQPEEGEKLRRELDLEGKRLLAYLPTYRGTGGKADPAAIRTRLELLKEVDGLLQEDEVILYKPHPLEAFQGTENFSHIRPFPVHLDTNYVLNACDGLITDYSSVFFDFACTGRLICLFTYDLEDYQTGRGLYVDPEDLPFAQARTPEELAAVLHGKKTLAAPDDAAWRAFHKRYLTWENGHGSRDALEALLQNRFSCETVSLHRDSRENVLLYAGNLAQNGVTAAFCNIYPLLDKERYNWFVSFRTDSVKEEPSRMDRLPPDADILPLASEMNLDPVTGFAQAVYLRFGFQGFGIRRRLERIYRTEWKKHFPNIRLKHAIHYNGYENYILSLMKEAPIPVTVGVHSNMEEEIRVRHNASRPLLRDLYRNCASVICVSRNGADSVRSISGRQEGVYVAPNCQNRDEIRRKAALPLRFDPGTESNVTVDELERILALPETRFACIGRYSPEKGNLRLVDAFLRFRREYPESWLLLAGGSGDLYEEVCRKASEKEAGGHIVAIRSLSNPMPILARCHLLLVPSEYEGCPVVPYEADFLDVPCACCDVPGCHELMERWGGCLVTPDEEGLVQAMKMGMEGSVPVMHIDPGPDNQRTLDVFYHCIETDSGYKTAFCRGKGKQE